MITLVAGYMGSGKSLFVVRYLYRHRKKYATILTNSPLNFAPAQYAENPLRLVQSAKPPIAIFLDEAHLLLDSRRATSKANVSWTKLLTLLRKLQVDLYITTQSLMQVDIRLRSLLRTFWVARGVQFLPTEEGNVEPYFVYEQYAVRLDPWTGKYIRFFLRTEALWWENAKKYFSLYDTNFIPAGWDETEGDTKEIAPTATVADLSGEYKTARDIQKYLRALGFPASDANYRSILRRLGFAVAVRKDSEGNRTYVVVPARQENIPHPVAPPP